MPVIPFGEWRPDVSDYNGQHTLRAENVFPRGDGYGPVPNLAEFTEALPAACRGGFLALRSDGTIAVFAGTATDLYLLNNTDSSWTNVSQGSDFLLLEDGSHSLLLQDGSRILLEGQAAQPYAVPAAKQWQFAQLGSVVIAVNGANNPQAYTLGSSSNFADLAGSPPVAAYVTVVNQFVVLSGLLSNPFRIVWSARSDPTGWIAGTNESDLQDFTDGGVLRGVSGGEFGFVFHDNAIREMIYQPGNPTVFSFNRIAEGKGLRAPYSLIKAGQRIFFKSAAGFEMLVPGSAPVPIGKERFDRFFNADVDTGNLQLLIGAYQPESSRVYWAYKSNTGAAGLFNKIIVWDFMLERGALITGVSGEYISALAKPGLTLENLDAIQPNIELWTTSFDDISAAFAVQLSLFSPNHKAGFLSGTNLEATIETAEFGSMNQRSFVRGFRVDTDCPTVAASLVTRDRLIDTAAVSSEATLNSIGYAPFRKDARLVKYRTRFPAAATWNFAIGGEPDSIATGQK